MYSVNSPVLTHLTILTCSNWFKYNFKHRYNTTRYQIIKLHHFSFHRWLFYLSPLSSISHWILQTQLSFLPTFCGVKNSTVTYKWRNKACACGGHSARCPRRKGADWGWDEIMFLFFEQQLQNAAFCKESFVFTCLTYQNIQHFQIGPVHEFYGLKASQMSSLC